ncbi:MAG: hypothetical protein GF411_12220 [Candidatus Lokiarchaeota archaeon]|nr:hypothetical protein [Candidatus Lokiarchaeota archaeon]
MNDHYNSCWSGDIELPDVSWLSGAKAGLQISEGRRPDWNWDEFLLDLDAMLQYFSDIQSAFPGQAPLLDDGIVGSILTALGGYISVTGYLLDDGLFFRVSKKYHEDVRIALSGYDVQPYCDGLIISKTDLARLQNILPIQGPLFELIYQEVMT